VIKGRVPVAHRPEGRESGQWESGLVVSRRSKAALQICVERNSRYVRISPLKDHSANENSRVLIRALRGLPCSSIAYDNGIENVLHQKVNDALGCVSYFCGPYHR
jgi:IS30 family transposase